MIYFDHLPLSKDIIKALMELKIEYVFQSIYYPDGKTIYAREALMRPADMDVTELIEKYTKLGKLHVLEVATFFGATQKFLLRSYKEKLAVNSFPCEIFSQEEVDTFIDYFGKDKEAMIIECLEYPEFSKEKSIVKRDYADINANLIAIDDYGTGFNDINIVDVVKPNIVKIDRTLLSNVDKDKYKQANCQAIIETMHYKGIKVVAEGVETEEEFNYMKSIGADYFQGYFLAMPK